MIGFKSECPDCLKSNNCRIDICNGKCRNFSPDSITYAQHRFYRGILLPTICEAMGENNFQYTHDFILKPRWLHQINGIAFYEYEQYNQIPNKHQATGKIWKLDNGNFALIPSMAKFTKKETKEYLLFCERFLFEELQGCIKPQDNKEYSVLRERIKLDK